MRKILLTPIVFMMIIAAIPCAIAAQETTTRILGLDEAIALAGERNGQLKMAALDVTRAEAELKQVRASFWPEFSAAAGRTESDPPNPMAPYPYGTELTLTQPLYAEALRIQRKLAEATLELRKLEYQEKMAQVEFDVTNAYYQAVKARLGREIAGRSLVQAEANLRVAQAQFAAGTLTKNQVLQMELAVADARQGLSKAGNLYRMALAGLCLQIGLPPDSAVEVEEPAAGLAAAPPGTAGKEAVDRRYDVRKALLGVDMARLGVALAKAGYYPQASLSLSYQAAGDRLTLEDSTTMLTLGLRWSFSTGGKTGAAVQAARAELAKAEEMYELARAGAELEIYQAGLEYQEAGERRKLAALSLDLARENLRLANRRYELGAGTPQEASEAQLRLEQAEMNHLNATYDLLLSALKLAKALGPSPTAVETKREDPA